MRISTKGQYSLEALLYLAMLPGKDFISTRSIADATGISEGYLEQLFIPLRKAGIIRGSRGKRGGYVPGREPERITVGDILRTAEGILEPVNCIKSIKCPISSECTSRNIWADLYREINSCVDSITLADLVNSLDKQSEKTREKTGTV